jgi:hypothetical protein
MSPLSAVSYSPDDIADILGYPFLHTAHQCHAVSIQLVKSGRLHRPGRVARGTCDGVFGQHSWVVLGQLGQAPADIDVYAEDAEILDATWWSYDDDVDGVWQGTAADGFHTPHGAGDIWSWGKPGNCAPGAAIELVEPAAGWSTDAAAFLRADVLGPLDRAGWSTLASAPVGGWPAAEIVAAIADTPALGEAFVPIDRLGMLTDRNPGGLYLP